MTAERRGTKHQGTEHRETERKYEADEGTQLPRLDDLPGVASESDVTEQLLEAEYYDTPALHLLRAGITLRRRRGGTDAGWHLKLPAGTDTRTEIRVPLGRTGRRVPAELSALVRAQTRGTALRQVAQIDTRRRLRVLRDAGGGSLAEVAEDDVTARSMGEATALTVWREIEVELTGGDPALLMAADGRLRRHGIRLAGQAAKLERALATELPVTAAPPPLTAASAAGDVVTGYLRAQLAALERQDPQVRRDTPDAVHQMRVATRRLRGALKAFPRVLRREETRQVSDELKWLGGVLGEARDAEVLAGRLLGSAGELPAELLLGPVQARLRAHFAPVSAAGRAQVLKALDSPRYFTLLDQLDQLISRPPLADAAGKPAVKELPRAVARMRRRLRRRQHAARHTGAGQARESALHEARKAAKDARYAAEVAIPAAGKPAARFARRMKNVTSRLGDHHDAVVARGVVRQIGVQAHLAGENGFSFGLLYQREQDQLEPSEARAWHAWRRSGRAKYRRWLG